MHISEWTIIFWSFKYFFRTAMHISFWQCIISEWPIIFRSGNTVTNLGCVRGQYHTNNEQTQSVEGII